MTIAQTTYRQGDPSTVPVVLVHAFPVDHRIWDECADRLIDCSAGDGDPAFGVYALEMPGAGECPVPTAEQTGPVAEDGAYPEAMTRMAESYAAALRKAGFDKAVWVGISMGGYLILELHRLHPEMFAGIMLCDTKAGGDAPATRANRVAIAEECERHDTVDPVMHFAEPHDGDSVWKRSDEAVALFSGWIRSQDPRGVAWRERMAAARPDETDQLAKITVPAGIVSGTLDPSSAPDRMRPIAEQMTGTDCAFTVIEDAGHFTCVEKPDEVARAILDLWRRAAAAD
ncbi:alpha/beta hydrolase [Bifidobacterium simiarum]|uniref:Alpha/beta hydrolase n=2 Tax=Bifidobacterium simiarum TaxID=2045441 RepID=A0A2M9HFA6_9BIFI|nr:alpha/beta hydrolase [Bifidobacterium simiarum]